MRYNYTIIDLYDRSAVETLDSAHITTELDIETLNITLKRCKPAKGLIFHSDQGRQFTAKEFNDFYKKNHIQQSMSKEECPDNNAPMKQFYKRLKNEFFSLYHFKLTEELDQKLYDFVYVKYNHVRPHSYNGGLTPYAARCTA